MYLYIYRHVYMYVYAYACVYTTKELCLKMPDEDIFNCVCFQSFRLKLSSLYSSSKIVY